MKHAYLPTTSLGTLTRTLICIALFGSLLGVGQAQADFIYVSRNNNTITRIDTTTLAETTFASTGLIHPHGLAFDGSSNLYAANQDGSESTIERFTPEPVGSVFASVGLNNPHDLAFDSSGNLYTSNWSNNTILRFTPGGVGSIFASGLNRPTGLAFDESGNLFVASQLDNTIMRFTPGGVGSLFANTGLDTPFDLAFDNAGNLYAANFGASSGASSIVRFTPGGVGSIFATGPVGLTGLAFDSANNLYAAYNPSSQIVRYTPSGVGTVINTGRNPVNLAFQSTAVPEPSSLALCGLSVATLVASRLRRHRSPA